MPAKFHVTCAIDHAQPFTSAGRLSNETYATASRPPALCRACRSESARACEFRSRLFQERSNLVLPERAPRRHRTGRNFSLPVCSALQLIMTVAAPMEWPSIATNGGLQLALRPLQCRRNVQHSSVVGGRIRNQVAEPALDAGLPHVRAQRGAAAFLVRPSRSRAIRHHAGPRQDTCSHLRCRPHPARSPLAEHSQTRQAHRPGAVSERILPRRLNQLLCAACPCQGQNYSGEC